MSDDLAKKLAERLYAAAGANLNVEERWQIVADTIELMIDKAILKFEGGLIQRFTSKPAHDTEVKP